MKEQQSAVSNQPSAKRRITVEVSDTVYNLLEVLARDHVGFSVEGIVSELIDHAQQGVYRPGAWERDWLIQAFGDEWIKHLEVGDPYGRPNGHMFNRPISVDPRKSAAKGVL